MILYRVQGIEYMDYYDLIVHGIGSIIVVIIIVKVDFVRYCCRGSRYATLMMDSDAIKMVR